MTNIAILDQQQIFREGLHRLIEAENDMNVVASENLLSDLDEDIIKRVDLFLIDVDILDHEEELIKKKILDRNKEQKVIIISSETKEVDVKVKEIILAGYHGFLLQEMSFNNFIQAVRTVIDGGAYIHPNVLNYILDDYRELVKGKQVTRKQKGLNKQNKEVVCTKRESEILQLLVNGNDNSSIAKALNISEKTVKNHLTNIFRKLDVKDRTQAAVLAIRNEWVEL